MAPAGTGSWTSLPTTFTGSQLLAHFNDAGLKGSYAFKVTVLRQRRQLRLNDSDGDAAGACAGHLRGQRRADPRRRDAPGPPSGTPPRRLVQDAFRRV